MTLEMMEAAVASDPFEETTQGALFDLLLEHGKSDLAARRRVNQLRRAAIAARLVARVKDQFRADGARASRLRGRIRGYCRLAPSTNVPITVVDGDSPPVMTGEGPYHTFRGKKGRDGGVCHYPGAAIRRGFKVDYHPDTRRITVGAGWVAELMDNGSVSHASG